ncbi:MAG: hypothetical protein ACI875_001438, partial [Planctomycetota bacterium]
GKSGRFSNLPSSVRKIFIVSPFLEIDLMR